MTMGKMFSFSKIVAACLLFVACSSKPSDVLMVDELPANKTAQMFHTNMRNKRIEVYDASSDVFVYDTETHTILADTIIMKKYWVENTPAFSPDGKWLYFTTAKRQVYPTDYDKEKYSLCRISFISRRSINMERLLSHFCCRSEILSRIIVIQCTLLTLRILHPSQ